MITDYAQAEKYLLEIPKFTKKNTVEATRIFYEFLGKPGSSSKIIHVAGTNGKGSTCAYMNAVLTEAGYKVGMFTSPHLVSVRERMRINNILISETEFKQCFQQVREAVEVYNEMEEVNKTGEEKANTMVKKQEYYPTFYEFLFFMTMLYFMRTVIKGIFYITGKYTIPVI